MFGKWRRRILCYVQYTVELTAEESGNVGCGDNLSGKDRDVDMEVDESMLRQFLFDIAHKSWSTLYDREGVLMLKTKIAYSFAADQEAYRKDIVWR